MDLSTAFRAQDDSNWTWSRGTEGDRLGVTMTAARRARHRFGSVWFEAE